MFDTHPHTDALTNKYIIKTHTHLNGLSRQYEMEISPVLETDVTVS